MQKGSKLDLSQFDLVDSTGEHWSRDPRKKLLLFFYPKALTPGCTEQACLYNDALGRFTELNIQVVGVSCDPSKKLTRFKEAHSLSYTLLQDTNTRFVEYCGVYKQKSMFGKHYMGIERSSLLLDEKGLVQAFWTKVKPKDDTRVVLGFIEALHKTKDLPRCTARN